MFQFDQNWLDHKVIINRNQITFMVLENLILFELTILLMLDFTVSDTRVLETTYIQV